MFKINHAVLHVFDFVSCVNVFSEDELDLTNKNVKSYVMRIARMRWAVWITVAGSSSLTAGLRRS